MSPPAHVSLCRVEGGAAPARWALATRRAVQDANGHPFIANKDLVAIKLHVGEPGLTTFLPPEIAAVLVSWAREQGGRPFLTDSAVLYESARSNGVEHTLTAHQHGFTPDRTGAPFLPADGLEGNIETTIPIAGRHFSQVGVARSVADSNALLVLSHATGHLASGFGATLKNLGMGCSSRMGKLLQHTDTKPYVRQKKCQACGACVIDCPSDAIHQDGDEPAFIDEPVCIGCGECIPHCRSHAIGFRWDTASADMQEKMVEHALGVAHAMKGKALYVTGLVNITQDCDCLAKQSKIVARDIGFAASRDPVALDQATLDVVEAQEGKRLDELSYPRCDGTVQLSYAEKLGLGSRQYDLVEVTL